MDKLPTELLSHILSYLDVRCQLRLSAVSVRWREAVSDCLRRRRCLKLKNTSDAELRVLMPRLTSLRTLDVRSYRQLDLDVVSENCPRLEKFNLSAFRLDAGSLGRLRRRCPQLWDVRLRWGFLPEELEMVLQELPDLRVLNLRGTDVSPAAVELLPASLERLELYKCYLEPNEQQPADRWPRLTELLLTDTGCYTGCESLVAGCPRLQRLKARRSNVGDYLLDLLPAFPVQHLDLSLCGDELSEDGLVNCFEGLRQLRTLSLHTMANVTDRVLDSLSGIESLTELSLGLTECELVPFTLEAVQRLVVLSPSLRLVKLDVDYDEVEEQMESLIASLSTVIVAPHDDVTLAIPDVLLEQMPGSVLPSPPSVLRVISL